jgi:hypothetical protein
MQHNLRVPLRQIVAALLACAALAVVALTHHAGAQASPPAASHSTAALTDIGPFEATVRAGPDSGLSLRGRLRLGADRNGQITGLLAPTHGHVVPVAGQFTGNAINLVFYLGSGTHVFGVGTIGRDPGAKQAFAGGPLVGPRTGDSGDWDVTSFNASGCNDEHTYEYSRNERRSHRNEPIRLARPCSARRETRLHGGRGRCKLLTLLTREVRHAPDRSRLTGSNPPDPHISTLRTTSTAACS